MPEQPLPGECERAIEAARPRCIWAEHHDGTTCIEATDASGYWCLVCKRAWQSTHIGRSQR